MDWQSCLNSWLLQIGTQDFQFLIFLGVAYLSYVISIATYAPTVFGYIISVLASVE